MRPSQLSMEQAIIEISPHMVKYRGIDGFWVGVTETNQIPRPVVMSLLGRIDPKNAGERERMIRFLMDAGWYPEAKQELDRLSKDFPRTDLSERAASARGFIVQAEATQRRSEIDMRRKAQQYHAMSSLLKTFNDKAIGSEHPGRGPRDRAPRVATAGGGQGPGDRAAPALRPAVQRRAVAMAEAVGRDPQGHRRGAGRGPRPVRRLAEGQGPTRRRTTRPASPWRCRAMSWARTRPWPTSRPPMSSGRPATRSMPTSPAPSPSGRSDSAAAIEGLAWPDFPGTTDAIRRLELLTRIVQLMPPPRHDGAAVPEKTTLHRVLEDENAEPTEYAVRLPPEYHPLRSYPAVIVLHSGQGPAAAIDEWAAEAARHGYILIAPEYNEPGQPHDYRYTTSEHAAVELALRDARKRYSIDSDRVFAAGQLIGGNMAWDYALAHPDLFAGVIVFSGLPAKYVFKYAPAPRAAPNALCHRRAGPRGQRGHLHQQYQADDPRRPGT